VPSVQPPCERVLKAHPPGPNSQAVPKGSSGQAAFARWLLLAAWILVAVGSSFAPWVDRPPAGLVLTAPDLAEFVKFLPEAPVGGLPIGRLCFLLPLFGATCSAPLVAAVPGLSRWALPL